MKKIKSFLNSWYLSIPIFFALVTYVAFYSVTEFDLLNSAFSISPLLTHIVDLISFIFLVSLIAFLESKKLFNKQFILIILFSLFYTGLQLWRYLYKSVSFDDSSFFDNHLSVWVSFDKLTIFASKGFINQFLISINCFLTIFLTVGLLIYLIKKNLKGLILLNLSIYQTFSSYLNKISKYIKNAIFKLLLKIKSLLISIYSRTNFIYIIKFIKILKCSLKQDWENRCLNFYLYK